MFLSYDNVSTANPWAVSYFELLPNGTNIRMNIYTVQELGVHHETDIIEILLQIVINCCHSCAINIIKARKNDVSRYF